MRSVLLTLLLLSVTSCTNHVPISPAHITTYNKQKIVECGSRKIVLVGGCFDVLHYGHLEYLRLAREAGDYLIVALEPDDRIIKYKKRNPIHNQHQRAINLAAIRYVDRVLKLPVLEDYKDYNDLVQNTCPSIIAITKGDPQLANIQKQAKQVGAKVKEVTPSLNEFSSSSIINTINETYFCR